MPLPSLPPAFHLIVLDSEVPAFERLNLPEVVLKLFAVAASPASLKMAAAILQKKLKVYSFNRDGRPVADISRLDPDSASPEELSWGGLTEFSARTADVVADFIASQGEVDSDEP